MLNKNSSNLVILVATYNRLESLKRSLTSIADGTQCSHEIIVIDGGSTDGTVEYLRTLSHITPVFQGKLIGQARACNEVWRQVNSKYTCWLNDDTELIAGSLDLAVDILDQGSDIGMVGLKMKDVDNPKPYMGAVSEYGIINCNHGVLPTDLLAKLGYFNEEYRSYGIDPDLTAAVLCSGKKVVMTKKVSVLHYREPTDQDKRRKELENYKAIYRQRFQFLGLNSRLQQLRLNIRFFMLKNLFRRAKADTLRFGMNRHDRKNLIKCNFIRWADPFFCWSLDHHLVQKIPTSLLLNKTNPYRHLLS